MKERRIVKQTRRDGCENYLVEERILLFGKVVIGWDSARKIVHYPDESSSVEIAEFETLEEAQRFCGIDTNPIIKREIVK